MKKEIDIKTIIDNYPNIEKSIINELKKVLIENHKKITRKEYNNQEYSDIEMIVKVLCFLGYGKKEELYKSITKQNAVCPYGNTMRYYRFKYHSCGGQCKCSKEKCKQTSFEKYGVEFTLQSTEVKEKSKQTNLQKYGVENPKQSAIIQEKTKNTNLKRYGVENPFASDEIKEKIKQTNMERYGAENPQQSTSIQEKTKNTNLEKYGMEYAIQTKEAREKTKNTNLEKYGTENPFASDEVKDKIKRTNMERYGVENSSQNPETRKKAKQTSFERYNVDFFAQKHLSNETISLLNNPEIFTKKYKDRYDYDICADELGINYTTLLKYRKKYGLEIKQNRSSYEFELEMFLIKNNINFEITNRKLISPYELDFYLPDYNLAIEMNGLYWHSEQIKGKKYHKMKYDMCKKQNIRLLMINEDEWVYRKNSIKNKILNLTGNSEKGCGARKLKIQTISNKIAMDFCEKYHIQGKTSNVKYSYGAFNNDNLVAVICVGLVRNTKTVNLSRFCTDGKIYAGVFSKLFKFYLNKHNPEEVITFADLRYSDGKLYEKTGFIKDKENKPDYMYVINGITYDKQNFTKAKIKKKYPEIYSDDKTEYQMMQEMGYDRIWDCGKIRYSRKIY